MTRIAILTPDEMNDEQRAVIDASKANGKPHGGPFWAYIRNPKLMQNVQNTAATVLKLDSRRKRSTRSTPASRCRPMTSVNCSRIRSPTNCLSTRD